ncbi:hypothetical protein JDV02_005960 [Purpureocillium takamizusanense]|uniref:Zn(2)-C6 fungal-type domain-containing protein n=1 Tax=Purpureocillium takamizusanense TaxID=2060973 RepID=A0A9Q8QFE0_9HYPO|nr:uncharacterized protein JDV02_005960 [Purpureocillium takamizusanense]UNI19809.1 hypothetical protein JDV02_005960 [Purpureocillium takamizusanense]
MGSHQPRLVATDRDQDGLKIWSCVTCRRRKVKCDRRDPCANCVRNGAECHFPVTGRLPRRSRDHTGAFSASASSSNRQAELLGRLRRLEDLVTELSGQLEDGSLPPAWQQQLGALSSGSSASAERNPLLGTDEMYEDFGRLVVDQGGRPRVDRGFWSIFCDEVEHIFQAIQDGSEEPEIAVRQRSSTDNWSAPDHCHGYLLGISCASTTDEDLYPLPSQIPFLWNTFVRNVDPFIKVLHGPSVGRIISETKGKLDALGPGIEAMLLSVCLAAIVSLGQNEVSDAFRISRTEMMARFRLGVERSLGRAQFATTRDVAVVQALAIYLSILPYIGASQLASTVTGALVRIATSMGLHKDELDGKQPNKAAGVEIETRRRLWWHICFIECRGMEPGLPGTGISEAGFTTRIPSNVDDDKIPDTSGATFAGGELRQTPTTLAIVRCEIWRLRRALRGRPDDTLPMQLRIVNDARTRIEGVCPLDPRSEDAFVSFLQTITGLALAKLEREIYRQHLRTFSTDSGAPAHESSQLLELNVAVIDAMRELGANPAWQRWRWQLQGRFPWRAVGFVFVQLCQMPWTPASERAWGLARGLFEGLPDGAKRDAQWRRLNELAAKAAAHRGRLLEERAMAREDGLDWNVLHMDETRAWQPNVEHFASDIAAGHQLTASGGDGAVARTMRLGGGREEAAEDRALQQGGDAHITTLEIERTQTLFAEGELEESVAADWERDEYTVDDILMDWPDWDDGTDMDIF